VWHSFGHGQQGDLDGRRGGSSGVGTGTVERPPGTTLIDELDPHGHRRLEFKTPET